MTMRRSATSTVGHLEGVVPSCTDADEGTRVGFSAEDGGVAGVLQHADGVAVADGASGVWVKHA